VSIKTGDLTLAKFIMRQVLVISQDMDVKNTYNILKKQEMNPLIPINIVIGDRSYRIKVEAKDEGVVRQTLKTINEKIIEFKTNLAGKDMQDYVSMVLIWYATELSSKVALEMEADHLVEKLASMEKMIDNHLNN
jgi:cell division protein ZapA